MPKVRKSKPKGRSGGRGGGAKRPAKSTRGGRGSGGSEQPEREVLHLKPPVTAATLAEALGMKPHEIVQELMMQNVMATINQALEAAVISTICEKHGLKAIIDKRDRPQEREEPKEIPPEEIVYDNAEVDPRPPVVAFLGHVDHGKTSLQDKLRSTDVTRGEAGGITQHIGASNIVWKDGEGQPHPITFIDTPGHEAFTAMRARGANTTDIAILVVAADDGIMPQTVEAIKHVNEAKVPMIVAVNKMDLPAADIDKVLLQLQQNNITPENWGGEVGVVPVSAHTGEGLDDLMERIVLEGQMMELRCNPKIPASAVVIEAELEQGLGATTNLLVKNGTLKVGDAVICGHHWGRVKALIDYNGKRIKSAGPSQPVKLVGLSGVPSCGMTLVACKNEKQAKRVAEQREAVDREETLGPVRNASLEDLFRQIEEESRKDLKVIVKADVQGSCEAVVQALQKLESPKIRVDVVHAGVGAICESDITLANASGALVVGFHVRVNPGVNKLASREEVEIRLYSIIYELTEQIKEAMVGMLDPELREQNLGSAEILQVFQMSKSKTKICGCMVRNGIMRVGAKARVWRDEELIYNGSISSLRRFKDDVKEVRQGFECGIRLDNFNDFDVGDRVEVYDYKEEVPTL
jgi:translation initiation factor IF-2